MRLVSACGALLALLPVLTESSRLTPPVLPLIVRNPYLSAWLPDARGKPWESWPMFWTGEHLGFSVLASLPHDRTAYPLLGRPQDSLGSHGDGYNVSYPVFLGSKYDASTTNLTYAISPRHSKHSFEITLSFLSPITPTSTLRQSIPAAYMHVFVTGNTDVDIYVDLNGQWVSGDRGNKIIWDLEQTHLSGEEQDTNLKTWIFKRDIEQLFTEIRDQSEWGSLCFTAPSDVRHEAGVSAELRQRFARTGTLQNIADDRFRGIMDEEPVFAFAKSFKGNRTGSSSGNAPESVMFTIAHIQNPVVQFAAARGLTQLRPLWASYMPKPKDLIAFHWLDFQHARELAWKYSAQLAVDAYKSGAEDYVDIVAVSARQVMGATHFLGTPEDPLLFMKEISSDGNTQTIDVIFPAFPFFLYTNPRWLAYLLEPLLEHMLSGQYPNKYAMHDIGSSYPNATGHPDGNDEYMPVEECGNILIMGLALANSIRYDTNSSVIAWQQGLHYLQGTDEKVFPLNTGSEAQLQYIDEPWTGGARSLKQARKWIERSYRLWKQWTSYLEEFSLRPQNQLSTDDFAGWLALQTNLALKGIIGIKAMAGLADIAGLQEDVKRYENTSRVYIEKWEEYGISRDKTHAKVAYNWFGSWTTTYNLYADALLCFHLEEASAKRAETGDQKPIGGGDKDGRHSGFVPKHIYQMQSDWYYAVRQKYGLPLDSRHLYTKTDWEFFAMAVAAPRVRADILQSVAKWVNETSTDRPLTDLHDTEGTGGFPGPNFFARPVIGGHFAFLTLERACGQKAMGGLDFLRDDVVDRETQMDVKGLLELEVLEAWAEGEEL